MPIQLKDIEKKDASASANETYEHIIEKSGENFERAVKKGMKTPFSKVFLRITIVSLLIASIGMFVTGLMRYSELQREKELLEQQIEDYNYQIEKLKYLIDCPVDYDYIVRVAREKLNLHLPDEIVYYNDTNE